MIKVITCLLILCTFFFGYISEPKAEVYDSASVTALEKSKADIGSKLGPEIVSEDCHDCSDDLCHAEEGHCLHHCSGIHNIINTKPTVKIHKFSFSNNKESWYFLFHYEEPALDPSLKPPLFS